MAGGTIRGQAAMGMVNAVATGLGELVKKIPFGRTAGALGAGVTGTTAVGFGALQVDEALRGENSILGRAKQNEASSNAAAGSQGWWGAIKEGLANFLELIEDFIPGMEGKFSGLKEKLRTNISRTNPETFTDALGKAVGEDPGNFALAASGPLAGLAIGTLTYVATRGKGKTGPVVDSQPAPKGPTPPAGPASGSGGITQGPTGGTPNKGINPDLAEFNAAKAAGQMDLFDNAHTTAKPNGVVRVPNAGHAVQEGLEHAHFKGKAGGLIGSVAFLGLGVVQNAMAGQNAPEAVASAVVQNVPMVDAVVKASQGDIGGAVQSAALDGGGLAGMAAGATIGASVGSIVPVFGTAVGGIAGSVIGYTVGSGAVGWAMDGISNMFNMNAANENQVAAPEQSIAPQEIASLEEETPVTQSMNASFQTASVGMMGADLGVGGGMSPMAYFGNNAPQANNANHPAAHNSNGSKRKKYADHSYQPVVA